MDTPELAKTINYKADVYIVLAMQCTNLNDSKVQEHYFNIRNKSDYFASGFMCITECYDHLEFLHVQRLHLTW